MSHAIDSLLNWLRQFLTQFLYFQISTIKAHRHSRSYKAVHITEALLILALILRFIIWHSALVRESWLIEHDPLLNFVHRKRLPYDVYTLLAAIVFCLYALLYQRTIYFIRTDESSAFSRVYELVVTNRDHYNSCLKRKHEIECLERQTENYFWHRIAALQQPAGCASVSKALLKPFMSIIAKLYVIYSMQNIDVSKMRRHYPLAVFRNFSIKLRIQLVLLQLACNFLAGFTYFIGVSGCLGFAVLFLPEILAPFPLQYWLLVLFDLILLVNCGHRILSNSLFMCFIGTLSSTAYRGHFLEINKSLARIGLLCGPLRRYDCSWLHFFHADHVTATVYLEHGNLQVSRMASFHVLLTIMPTNIYLVYRSTIMSANIIWLELFFTRVAIAIEFALLSFVHFPMAWCNAALYQTANFLWPIHFKLNKSNFTLMLKLANFQFQFSPHLKPFGYSIGPVTTLSHRTLMDLTLNYGMYLTCLFSLLLHL